MQFEQRQIRRWILLFAICLVLVGSDANGQSAPQHSVGYLGAGTTWETRWHVIKSEVPGPTVLIVGGVHGNEPAGFRAAEQIRNWPINRGKLVVIPQVNRLGLAANTRWSPDHRNDRKTRDLNRNFSTKDQPQPRTEHCQALWEFVSEHKPDWVFDLHEGFDFHCINPKSVGSSVIAFPAQAKFAGMLQDAVNQQIEPSRHFDLLSESGPAIGSVARACQEQLGAKSFILETTFKGQPVSLRARQHRLMVSTAMMRIGLLNKDQVDRLVPTPSSSLTRIGVFDDNGANEAKLMRVLDNRPELFVTLLGAGDIRPSVLNQFDVLIFPGGSGSKQGKAIGEQGRESIRQFVREGGGVVGICAGAYLCSSHYDWSLNLMNASVFNKMVDIPGKGRKSMWYRGKGANVDVEINPDGAQIFGLGGLHSIRYENGPILSPGSDSDSPEFKTLAFFRSENGIYDAQKNTMVGKPAVVESRFGGGKVLAISPHFETTKGAESVVLKAIEHVRRADSK